MIMTVIFINIAEHTGTRKRTHHIHRGYTRKFDYYCAQSWSKASGVHMLVFAHLHNQHFKFTHHIRCFDKVLRYILYLSHTHTHIHKYYTAHYISQYTQHLPSIRAEFNLNIKSRARHTMFRNSSVKNRLHPHFGRNVKFFVPQESLLCEIMESNKCDGKCAPIVNSLLLTQAEFQSCAYTHTHTYHAIKKSVKSVHCSQHGHQLNKNNAMIRNAILLCHFIEYFK